MIDAKKLQQLDIAFQRILTLPVSKSSFRQMQNAILFFVDGDRDMATQLLEAFLTGNLNKNDEKNAAMQEMVERYSLPMSVAREVSERGDFLSIITSDILNHPEMPLFGNRIRRVDGQEFDFITNAESTLQLLLHFSTRLQELEKVEKSKNVLQGLKSELVGLKKRIEELIQNATN